MIALCKLGKAAACYDLHSLLPDDCFSLPTTPHATLVVLRNACQFLNVNESALHTELRRLPWADKRLVHGLLQKYQQGKHVTVVNSAHSTNNENSFNSTPLLAFFFHLISDVVGLALPGGQKLFGLQCTDARRRATFQPAFSGGILAIICVGKPVCIVLQWYTNGKPIGDSQTVLSSGCVDLFFVTCPKGDKYTLKHSHK